MKIMHAFALAALALSTGVVAHASPLSGTINLTGSSTTNTTLDTIKFNSQYGEVVPTTNGSFADFLGTTPDYSSKTLNYGSFTGTYQLFTDTIYDPFYGLETLAYTIDDISSFGADGSGYTITGLGDFTLDGGSTPGLFTYTTQPGGKASFSITADTAVAPEPESLALFGTGLLGLVGIARRKFSV